MRNKLIRTISLLWVLLLPLSARAQTAQPTPMPGTFVHDFAGVISDEKKSVIQAQAQRMRDEYKTEVAVVTIDSLEGEDIFDYSMRMSRSWGIGSKDNDIRGLLILIAIKDRKTAFRTSRHIEGEMTDGVAGEISRRMNASFKQGDFGGGLSLGMGMILDRLNAAYQPQPVATRLPETDTGLGWLWLPIGLFPLGLGYVILRHRRKTGGDAASAQQATDGGSQEGASSADPSTVSHDERKTSGYTTPLPVHSSSEDTTPSYIAHGSQSSDFGSGSSDASSSSCDSGSSSGTDSATSYSGGSDFGGGGTDTSW
jgi:uncharacterized membrane protein YgcG